MIREIWSCSLSGEKFHPSTVEEFFTDSDIVNKKTPGEIGITGRYRGKELPYGSVHFISSIERVLSFLEDVQKKEGLSIEDKDVTLTVAYENQCNIEIDPTHVLRLGKLGIPFLITCYEDPDFIEPIFLDE